jgi:hypothetical protein
MIHFWNHWVLLHRDMRLWHWDYWHRHASLLHLIYDIVLDLTAEHVNDGRETHLLLNAQILMVVAHDHIEEISIVLLHFLALEVVILQV